MKHVTQSIALIAGAILAFPILLSADQIDAGSQLGAEKYQLPDLQVSGIDSLPVLTKQVSPRVKNDLVGLTLVMKFSVDKEGRIGNIRSSKPIHGYPNPRLRDFAAYMTTMLNYWKFEPARDTNGQAISTNIIMPVKVVERDGNAYAQASLRLDTSAES